MTLSKNIVKKVIIPTILLLLIVALIFKMCGGKSDSSVSEPEISQVNIDLVLQHKIDSFVRKVPHVGTLGIMFYDATAQKEIYSHNADSLLSPASSLKLVTCVTALRHFGRYTQHKSRLYTSGSMRGDTLMGNVTLKVQFDPQFNRDSLYQLVESLRSHGIKHINGKVVVDMADHSGMNHEEHWTIGDLRQYYLGLPFSGYKKLRKEMLYALANKGVHVKASDIVYGRLDYHRSTLIAEIRTPMRTSIRKALCNSSNVNSESILYPLGYLRSRNGGFRRNGVEVMRNFIAKDLGMDTLTSCHIDDGCGLCPYDKLTPRLLVNLLNYSYKHKVIYQELLADLPVSGRSGTLYDRLRYPNTIDKIMAKTGTLTREGGVSSLTGYFTTPDQHLIIFSIINNNCPVADGRWWQDKLFQSIL